MNSAIKATAGLLFSAIVAIGPAYSAPDITIQTIPFNFLAADAYASLSADGRYVSYKKQQSGGGTYRSDIFIQDLLTGERTSANLTLTGGAAPVSSSCNMPSMSANGRYVVFGCRASDMGGVTASDSAYFVYDKEKNSTQMIPDAGDDQPFYGYATGISSDGRFVSFKTATGSHVWKIFVRDLVNNTTSGTNAQFAQSGITRMPISTDGRYIAYLGKEAITSPANNVSVYDRVSGVTEAIDLTVNGVRSTGAALEVTMSDDGSVVAFVSNDGTLAEPVLATKVNEAYVRDRRTGKTERVSPGIGGVLNAAVSGNGRYVSYLKGNIMYVYDRATKGTRKVILSSLVGFGTGRFSTDGRYLAFTTANTALNMQSVTVADLGAAAGVALSANTLELTEGGVAGTYTVVLTQVPDSDVRITVGTSAQLSLARTELTFTPANWSTPQTVSVQAVADGITESTHTATIVHTITTTDANYSVVQPADVTVTISDGIVPTIVTPGTTWTKTEMPLSGTAAPGSTVLLTASNRSTGWLSSVSTVADAQGKWGYTLAGYTDGILDLDVQADGLKSVARSVTVTLAATLPAPTYSDVTGYIRTTAYGLAYNRSTGKYVGNFMLTNTGSISLAGPLHLQFDNLTAGVTLSNATGIHNGSAYITVSAGLEPDGSVTIPLVFDNPSKGAINYDAKIYSGTF